LKKVKKIRVDFSTESFKTFIFAEQLEILHF
jgi:hypothetical protein